MRYDETKFAARRRAVMRACTRITLGVEARAVATGRIDVGGTRGRVRRLRACVYIYMYMYRRAVYVWPCELTAVAG